MAQPKSRPTTVSEDSKWTENELLNLNTWIYCICLVDFDLTEGQITKFVYPFDILSSEERANIANLSFPDTHTSNKDVVNAKFVFRFRARMIHQNKTKNKTTSIQLSGKRKLSYSHRHKSHPYLFGYVFFRQKPDKSIERGYFQKAIVIITPIPYIHVFVQAAEIIGSLYFEYNAGIKILDTACRNICSWPLPNLEGEVNLPLLGHIIRVVLQPKSVPPSASILVPRNHPLYHKKHMSLHLHNKPNKANNNSAENGYQLVDKHSTHSSGGCFQEINIYRYFHVVLGNLWCLWELALTGQALLVIASSAQECSHSVLGIMSLISPIAYHGDFRPYFTIYDDDFKHFCNLHDRDMLPPLILGVTNPFFLKVMPKFPHILVLSNANCTDNMTHNEDKEHGDDNEDVNSDNDQLDEDNNNNDNDKNVKSVMTIHVKTTNMDQHQPTVKKNSQRVWGAIKEVDVSKSHNTIISKSTPCLFPDEQVLSRLLTVSKATTSAGITLNTNELEIEQVCILNNATLRKYFQHLTEKFLEPFQEYFTFKVPSGMWNPYLNPPNLKTFQKDNFLNIIRDIPKSFLNEIPLRTSTLPTGKRSVLVKLYSKFLKSPHFPSWFNKKRERAKRKCDKIIHKMIRKIKFERLVEGKPVREGIKMYQTIHRHMNNNNQSAKPKADLNDVLIRHRAVLRSALPSQIIEALDEQVEKMRKDQIKKRKEWQVKYQQHLKQQRAVYNLDDHENDNENEEQEIKNNFNDDSSISHSPGNPPTEKMSRSKSYETQKNKKNKKNNSQKSPNKMLTSPSLNIRDNKQSISSLTSASSVLTTPSSNNQNDLASSPEQNSSLKPFQPSKPSTHDNETKRYKKVKLSSKSDIFDHSSPSIFTSSMSMGLGGGLAPNINFNIHKYHRYHNKSDLFNKKSNGITKSADYRHSTKTKTKTKIYKHNLIKRKHGNNSGPYSFDETETINHHHQNQNFIYFQYQQRQRQKAALRSDLSHRAASSESSYKNRKKSKKNKNLHAGRQRASSSESIVISSTAQTYPKKDDRKFSKDDNYTSHYKYYAGKNRNNSPKMTPTLFDLSNLNDFVATNDTTSVVHDDNFTSAHDDNFKLFENHF